LLKTGNSAVDRFIAEDYENVLGMSSRFAAAICGYVLRRQSELGIAGNFLEIGTFEGRFFIAMALGLAAEEQALGIDSFDWPDDGLLERFHTNCARHGLAHGRYQALKASTKNLTSENISQALGGAARFIHIDGDHAPDSLRKDLLLAAPLLHPQGIICLDDMLHPGYPLLAAVVAEWLQQHPEMRVLCIIDREDIVAAAKFMICRADAVPLFRDDLLKTFTAQHYPLDGQFDGYMALVLTPHPRLAKIN
jgi:predicted O-methyltransferase YrrM